MLSLIKNIITTGSTSGAEISNQINSTAEVFLPPSLLQPLSLLAPSPSRLPLTPLSKHLRVICPSTLRSLTDNEEHVYIVYDSCVCMFTLFMTAGTRTSREQQSLECCITDCNWIGIKQAMKDDYKLNFINKINKRKNKRRTK